MKVATLRKSGAKRYSLASSLTSFGFANSNDLFCLRLRIHEVALDGMRAQQCLELAGLCWHQAGEGGMDDLCGLEYS